jgi:hypothetical protein
MNDLQHVLLHILKIIDYQEDKKAQVNKFVLSCFQNALILALKRLPEGKRNDLEKEIANKKDATLTDVGNMMSNHIGFTAYAKLVNTLANQQFEGYIETLVLGLEETKKKEVSEYIHSFPKGSFMLLQVEE